VSRGLSVVVLADSAVPLVAEDVGSRGGGRERGTGGATPLPRSV